MFFSIFWTTYIPIAVVILSLAADWLMGIDATGWRRRAGRVVELARVRHKSSWRNGQLHEAAVAAMVRHERTSHSRPRR